MLSIASENLLSVEMLKGRTWKHLLCKTVGSGTARGRCEQLMFFKAARRLGLTRGRSGAFKGTPAGEPSSMIVDVPCNFITAPAVLHVWLTVTRSKRSLAKAPLIPPPPTQSDTALCWRMLKMVLSSITARSGVNSVKLKASHRKFVRISFTPETVSGRSCCSQNTIPSWPVSWEI